eukprot:c16297_g1_i4.p3 GENE.c16297_g1_i4~~c16297_g1_i4.p3  ORF type:complete len:214 (+),score=7.99 c16297_g1_i4:302-943(+)
MSASVVADQVIGHGNVRGAETVTAATVTVTETEAIVAEGLNHVLDPNRALVLVRALHATSAESTLAAPNASLLLVAPARGRRPGPVTNPALLLRIAPLLPSTRRRNTDRGRARLMLGRRRKSEPTTNQTRMRNPRTRASRAQERRTMGNLPRDETVPHRVIIRPEDPRRTVRTTAMPNPPTAHREAAAFGPLVAVVSRLVASVHSLCRFSWVE